MASKGRADVGLGLKLVIGLSTLLSTVVATGVGALINQHFVEQQTTTAMRQGDVRKLEEQIQAFDTAMRVYVVGVNKGKPSDAARETVTSNIEQQYSFLQTLVPLVIDDIQRKQVTDYGVSLLEVSRKLRTSRDVPTTIPLAQSVAHAIDARIAATRSLRVAVGLPVASQPADALTPANIFARNEQAF